MLFSPRTESINAQFSELAKKPTATPKPKPTKPATDNNTIDDGDKRIVYKGKWAKANHKNAYKGSYHDSNKKGDTATFAFSGSSIQIETITGPNRGITNVSIDGTSVGNFDGYSKELNFGVWKGPYTTTSGQHTLTISVGNSKNNASKGTFTVIDAIKVDSTTGGGQLSPQQIPVGDKDMLTLNIGGGGGNGPQVNFGIKLYGVEKTPDVKVRLKVVNLAAQITPMPTPSVDTCQNPSGGESYFKDIIMTADGNGVYHPKPGTSYTTLNDNDGVSISSGSATVTSDGWVTLSGVTAGRAYGLFVKGEKHRSMQMVANVVLQLASPSAQKFDWTANPLDPGDLPDPSNNNQQDCVVNSNDISLLKNREGSSSSSDLGVADLDYNNIVNAADMGLVMHTLTTKPDDE